MNKEEFLSFLRDKDVVAAILEMVYQNKSEAEGNLALPQKNEWEQLLQEAEEKNQQLEAARAKAEAEAADARQRLQKTTRENEELREKLSAAAGSLENLKEIYETLQDRQHQTEKENKRLQNQLPVLNHEVSQMKQMIEINERQWQTEKQAFHKEISTLQENNRKLKSEIGKLEMESKQRFKEGWELFKEYQHVSEEKKQLLSGVFPVADSFTAFICGGAQDESLGMLWDVLKGCLKQGNEADGSILWDIFQYCLQLVNASKSECIYEILDVEEGEPFDLDLHTLAQGSRAQGRITDVYLPGYKNVYAQRIERKSIVSIT